MDIKALALKFWKPIAAIGAALIAIFIYKSAKSSEATVSAKVDTKDQVDAAVTSLKPETEAAIKAVQVVNAAPVSQHEDPSKDLQSVVDDYNKE